MGGAVLSHRPNDVKFRNRDMRLHMNSHFPWGNDLEPKL